MIFRKLPLVASLLTVTMLCGFMAEATAANVAPVITPSSSTKGQLWNTGATPITPPTATITDPDSLDFSGGTLTVKMVALNGSTVLATDVLSIRNQGTAAGEIGFTGVPPFNVTYGGTLIGSANATSVNGTMNLVVTFNGAATSVAAQALLRNVTYQSGNTLNSAIGKKTTVLFQDRKSVV